MGLQEIQNYFVGLCIFCLLIVGALIVVNNSQEKTSSRYVQNSEINSFKNDFNITNSLVDYSHTLQGQLKTNNTGSIADRLGFISALISVAWDTVKLIPNSIDVTYNVMKSIPSHIGIPKAMTDLVLAALIIIVAFGIIAAIFLRGVNY